MAPLNLKKAHHAMETQSAATEKLYRSYRFAIH